MSSARRQVLFLDDDPAVRLVRALASFPLPDAIRDWLPGYFWPETAPDPDGRFPALRRAIGWPEDARGVHTTDPLSLSFAERASVEAIVFRRGRIDRALVDALPNLRIIQRFGSLAPEVEPAAAGAIGARGIDVCVFPRASLASVAEHAMALVLAVRRRLRALDIATRAGKLARNDRSEFGPVTYNWTGAGAVPLLRGSRAGIVGMGEIGTDIARLLGAFGVEVCYCNRRRLPEAREREIGVRYRSLDQMLADVDTLLIAATPAADGAPVIGSRELERMRPTAILVNIARGSLVDEAALATALDRRTIAGAGLDVYAQEPLSTTSPLVGLSTVLLSPHVAGGTRSQLLDEAAQIAGNVAASLRGEAPAHRLVVNGSLP